MALAWHLVQARRHVEICIVQKEKGRRESTGERRRFALLYYRLPPFLLFYKVHGMNRRMAKTGRPCWYVGMTALLLSCALARCRRSSGSESSSNINSDDDQRKDGLGIDNGQNDEYDDLSA